MAARLWPAVALAGLTLHCASPVEELPEVKVPLILREPCVDQRRAVTLADVPTLKTTDIDSCVSIAWSSRCDGSMTFDVDVDKSGHVGEPRFQGDASPDLRRCIRRVLAKGIPLPQGQCGDVHTGATLRGGISWPKNGGTRVHFAGDSGIIPCLRSCTAGDTGGGPTRGCT